MDDKYLREQLDKIWSKLEDLHVTLAGLDSRVTTVVNHHSHDIETLQNRVWWIVGIGISVLLTLAIGKITRNF